MCNEIIEPVADNRVPVCRICLDDQKKGLIEPCYCKGTMAKVHQHCLDEWLSVSGTKKCDVCLYKFNVRPVQEYCMWVSFKHWLEEDAWSAAADLFDPEIMTAIIILWSNLYAILFIFNNWYEAVFIPFTLFQIHSLIFDRNFMSSIRCFIVLLFFGYSYYHHFDLDPEAKQEIFMFLYPKICALLLPLFISLLLLDWFLFARAKELLILQLYS